VQARSSISSLFLSNRLVVWRGTLVGLKKGKLVVSFPSLDSYAREVHLVSVSDSLLRSISRLSSYAFISNGLIYQALSSVENLSFFLDFSAFFQLCPLCESVLVKIKKQPWRNWYCFMRY